MIRSVSFTGAVFEVFAEAYLYFLVSASAKKLPRIKFLGILKKTSPRIKYIFFKKEKQCFEHFEYFQT